MDPYSILGVEKNADDATIKSAYRKLAKQFHPDLNPDNKVAEAKFKDISAAYDLIKDEESRKKFNSPKPQFRPQGFGYHEFQDIFNQHFGFGRNFGQGFQRGNPTLRTTTQISLEDAYYGKEFMVNLENKTLKVQIPKGIQNGQTINLTGQGVIQNPQLPPGDLHINIIVQDHPIFTPIENSCLLATIKIDIFDYILGIRQEIKTLDGKTISYTIPHNYTNNQVRIRGKGMPFLNQEVYGDLIIVPELIVPNMDENQKQELLKWKGN